MPATGNRCFGKNADPDDRAPDDDVNGKRRVPVVAAKMIPYTGAGVDGNQDGFVVDELVDAIVAFLNGIYSVGISELPTALSYPTS